MYTLTEPNALSDVVDSMPYRSGWAPGRRTPRLAPPARPCGCGAEDGLAGANVGISEGGLSVNSGTSVSWPWLLAGGAVLYLVVFKKRPAAKS